MGTNFTLNIAIYDETEDFYDNELKYPYNKRKTVIGSYAVDYDAPTFDTQTVYFKKSEVCEEKQDWSKRVSTIEDKSSRGYVTGKTCTHSKLKFSDVVSTKPGSDSGG